jgi:hypothetical protein
MIKENKIMSMDTSVKAYISDQDETYQKHKKVLLACLEANVSLPEATAEYFGEDHPEEYLLEKKLQCEVFYEEWSDDNSEGIEIKIEDIPKGVFKIRFVNSW